MRCGACSKELSSWLEPHDYDACKAYAESKMIDGNKWIRFEFDRQLEKTQKWCVVNKSSNKPIAEIKWYSTWRQYVLFPEPNTVLNDGCLETIIVFIKRLNKEKSI